MLIDGYLDVVHVDGFLDCRQCIDLAHPSHNPGIIPNRLQIALEVDIVDRVESIYLGGSYVAIEGQKGPTL